MAEVKSTVFGLGQSEWGSMLLLKAEESDRYLVIPVSMESFQSLVLALEGQDVPCGTSHDAMKEMITVLEAPMEKAVIHDIKNGSVLAKIYLRKNGETVQVNARPSDAVALALKTSSPIFVEDSVFERAVGNQKEIADEGSTSQNLHSDADLAWLASLNRLTKH